MQPGREGGEGGTMLLRIAIVEDDAPERAKVRSCLEELAESDRLELEIDEYPSGMAFTMGEMKGYDIVLMDVDMPKMNGIEAARQLRQVDKSAVLVFVTNMVQFAVSGYEVEALDYIIKPINRYSFLLKMRRAVSRTAGRDEGVISIRSGGVLHRVETGTIHYLEVQGHYVTFHTSSGEYTEYTTLKAVKENIRQKGFAQCSQSFLVNLRYVASVSRESLVIDDGTVIPISRKMRQAFLTAMGEYCGGASL